MPDRVRESIFNILGAYYGMPGWLPDLRVADVFAGSGSLGLEALSRGAGLCRFFEQDREAVRVLQGNLDLLHVGSEGEIITGNAWIVGGRGLHSGSEYDLVFLDPPYRDSHDATGAGQVAQYLLRASVWFASSVLVVFHHERGVVYPDVPASGWCVHDRRTFGTHAITFLKRSIGDVPAGETAP